MGKISSLFTNKSGQQLKIIGKVVNDAQIFYYSMKMIEDKGKNITLNDLNIHKRH